MFLACDQGMCGIIRDLGQVWISSYGIDEKTGEHGVPFPAMWFALVRVFRAIYLLKVAWREVVATEDANRREASAYQLPRKSQTRKATRTGEHRGFSQVEAACLSEGYSKTSGYTGIWCVPRSTRSLVIG